MACRAGDVRSAERYPPSEACCFLVTTFWSALRTVPYGTSNLEYPAPILSVLIQYAEHDRKGLNPGVGLALKSEHSQSS